MYEDLGSYFHEDVNDDDEEGDDIVGSVYKDDADEDNDTDSSVVVIAVRRNRFTVETFLVCVAESGMFTGKSLPVNK